MTDISKTLVTFDTRRIDNPFCFTGITQCTCLLCIGLYGHHTASCLKVLCSSIRTSNDLHNTIGDAVIGKPAEAHAMPWVAVDGSHHTIRHLFGLQLIHLFIHGCDISLRHISTRGLFSYTQLRETGHGIVRCLVRRINFLHFRFRNNHFGGILRIRARRRSNWYFRFLTCCEQNRAAHHQ